MLNTMTSNKKEAEKESQNIKARGGAGVLMFKNSYLVVTSCYDNEAQAQSVCQSLSTEEENFVVEEEKISIDLKPFSKEEKEILLSHLTFFETNIIEIYNLSNSLDQNNASSILANLKLKSIKLEADSITNSLIKSDERFEGVKKAFLSFESALEYGSEQSHLNSAIVPYSSVLREIIIHSVISFCEINKNNWILLSCFLCLLLFENVF